MQKELRFYELRPIEYDIEYGETLFGSRELLEMIYENQNPPDCDNAQYIISSGWPFGFGSRIHMEGVGLSIGLNIGSVKYAINIKI
jgi:hypothetical protein